MVTDQQGRPVLPYELSDPRPEGISALGAAAPWWMWAAFVTVAAVTAIGFITVIVRLSISARMASRGGDPRRCSDGPALDGVAVALGLRTRRNAHPASESSRDGARRFGRLWRKDFTPDAKANGASAGNGGGDEHLADLASAAARKGWTLIAAGTLVPVAARSGPWDLTLARGHKILLVRRADPAGGIGKSKFGDVWLVHNPGTAEAAIEHASGSDELKFTQFLSWVNQPVDAEPRPDWRSRHLVDAELPSSYARDTATFDDAVDWAQAWNAGVDALLGALDTLVAEYPNKSRHNMFQRYGTYTRNVADRIEVQIGRAEKIMPGDGFLLVRDTATEMQLRCDYPDRLPTPAALIGLIRGQLQTGPQP
ncbi:Uncharacterised protein [Mycobacteroides abscessus subsp. abscessus]|nr:Uncharacterised protein [Mycobacteroides abscessus subsp. abscessus]SIC94292.1 Uncharacterised protein [Mycobacteroides abscessus subsp. abscessus]SID22108.1 Uncharacterised protein [Mycobacteroides abscessus subsp. abscessus]SKV98807.1 Uncharacterised protein [Mycobacteroides abscessus subsp. abscessus]SKW04600.1 Uncharacterised protein [Mycobacteroides abscessus subsp. abscessus]